VCSSLEAIAYLAVTEEQTASWDDEVALAQNTPRIALASRIAVLQQIRRDTAGLAVPTCAEKAHAQLITYMDSVIDMFMLFMSGSDDLEVQAAADAANAEFALFETMLDELIEE